MKQLIEYINEVKFAVNKKEDTKKYDIYYFERIKSYLVKVNSYNDIVYLAKNVANNDELKKIKNFFSKETFDRGVFIRPIIKKSGETSISTFWYSKNDNINELTYFSTITKNQFNVKYWKKQGWENTI